MAMKYTIGADPELFVRSKETGQFISGHGLVPGTKEAPSLVPQGAIQVDGMALEFNINPASTIVEFSRNIKTVMEQLQHAAGEQYDLVPIPSVEFSKEVWDNTPDYAKELGCNPDMNAYTGTEQPSPEDVGRMRAAGGHIHIGWQGDQEIDFMSEGHIEACKVVTKQLDFTLGVQSLLWDNDNGRRQMYGKAGSFRPKPYGVEYRTLSNAWLKSEKLIKHVFRTVKKSLLNLENGRHDYSHYSEVKESINRGSLRYFGGERVYRNCMGDCDFHSIWRE